MKIQKMKIHLLSALMVMFLSLTAAIAQEKKHDPQARAKKQTEWMKTELSLSNEQASKIEGINLKYASQAGKTKEEAQANMKSVREARNKEIEGVLTKDQLVKYNTKKEEMKAKRKAAGHKGGMKSGKKCEGKK